MKPKPNSNNINGSNGDNNAVVPTNGNDSNDVDPTTDPAITNATTNVGTDPTATAAVTDTVTTTDVNGKTPSRVERLKNYLTNTRKTNTVKPLDQGNATTSTPASKTKKSWPRLFNN